MPPPSLEMLHINNLYVSAHQGECILGLLITQCNQFIPLKITC
jgi:hypothetical protein